MERLEETRVFREEGAYRGMRGMVVGSDGVCGLELEMKKACYLVG